MIYYVMRPSEPLPGGRRIYTRYGPTTLLEQRAIQTADRVGGRVYSYDGEHELVYDAVDAAARAQALARQQQARYWTPERLRADGLI
jgi:hypothetical protein